MNLSERAAAALAAVRREGRELRFVVDEICHSGHFRLSVRYRAPAGGEVRLGLVYADYPVALEALGARLGEAVLPPEQAQPSKAST